MENQLDIGIWDKNWLLDTCGLPGIPPRQMNADGWMMERLGRFGFSLKNPARLKRAV
jgi:hypothetical protein